MTKIAIIGASSGQLALVDKAKEMGIITYCFAWDKNAVCKQKCDFFYPISIYDTDKIVEICLKENIEGVVSNASEETAIACANVAEKLGLLTTPSTTLHRIQSKKSVRELTSHTKGLSIPIVFENDLSNIQFPCVVKPIKGSAKRGVTFCNSLQEAKKAIQYAREVNDEYLIEEFIEGSEFSVESLSFEGKHDIIQITQKVTTGHPHFVELEHHQPALIDDMLRKNINEVVANVLTDVGFTYGASHIEIKIRDGNIYLIEINPRGGGDHISDTLVHLSTDCDYIKQLILIALGEYLPSKVKNIGYSGIIFLNLQNKKRLKYFDCPLKNWMIERWRDQNELCESTSNYDRNGYLIYKSEERLYL